MSNQLVPKKKNKKFSGSAKYDYVKVKIMLEKHYYIFSRFILSRMLTLSQVSAQDSNKISLELKKILVDNEILVIKQDEFEKKLFALMIEYKYTQKTIHYYGMMRDFHHKRVPLLIFLFGSGCLGKSSLATQLTERLNLPNVLQTDVLFDLSHENKPSWMRKWDQKEDFLSEYKKECKVMYDVLQGDIGKTMSSGKSLIIEGTHINPEDFEKLFENSKKGIVIPFLFSMKDEDHEIFIEKWIDSREINDGLERFKELKKNFQILSSFLLEKKTKNCIIVNIDSDSFQNCLRDIHDHVLKRIDDAFEQGLF